MVLIRKPSKEIMSEFLSSNNITLDLDHYISESVSSNLTNLPADITRRIIGDAYGSKNKIVKKVSDYLVKQYDIYLGRVQKEQLKKYLDYRFDEDFDTLIKLVLQELPENFDFKHIIDKFDDGEEELNNAITEFLSHLEEAIKSSKRDRVKDYLFFLYSRLLSLNERSTISLSELFSENENISKHELTNNDFLELKNFCSDDNKDLRFKTIKKFNEKYIELLHRNGDKNKKAGLIYIDLDQKLFDTFKVENDFYDYILTLIKQSYEFSENHKSLIIKIQNIFCNGVNLKWKLYAFVSIFAEKFKESPELRTYYKGVEILADTLEHKYGLRFSYEETNLINDLLQEKITYEAFKLKTKIKIKYHEEILSFKNINHGFSFIDCYILKNKNSSKNSDEIDFIKNYDDILLIFSKHKTDDRKIPCPVCASLRISGNSYPEVGIKSWECKNPLCSARSKTNRGKRYSERTILMQDATFDFSKENQISKDLIKIWRKDIVKDWNLNQLYLMMIKYFTFVNDRIITINVENVELFKEISSNCKREVTNYSFEKFTDFKSYERGLFTDFFEKSQFINRILYNKETIGKNEKYRTEFDNTNTIKIIEGDSLEVLNSIQPNSVDHMVTSPPYYNAREYSQWKNLYNYLNDMYQINLKSYITLKPGSVFFYNIGDIFDNENITVKSKMGEKRTPLGAYTIVLFLKAGFDILDNILWYKGEPQSNRHKNDGNYTPYYQRPANCYEHMFIFKKKGKLIVNTNKEENILTENIVKFTPVFKIFKGGENRYGHTAPYPHILPKYSISCFTNKKDIVLDPFSGSGTSAIVAAKMNRVGIGIELNHDYVKLSLEKINESNLSNHFDISTINPLNPKSNTLSQYF